MEEARNKGVDLFGYQCGVCGYYLVSMLEMKKRYGFYDMISHRTLRKGNGRVHLLGIKMLFQRTC